MKLPCTVDRETCIKAPARTEAAVSPLGVMQSRAISIGARPLPDFLSQADTPDCHGIVSGPLPNLQVLVFLSSSQSISPKLIAFQPFSCVFVPDGRSPTCLLPQSRTSLSRASSFQTDEAPPACFFSRG